MDVEERERDGLEQQLAQMFDELHVDCVPDPMVLRAAELFILGSSGSHHVLIDGSPDDVWAVLDKNLDGILAFFHLLMTRERIPLIDYGFTFAESAFHELLRDAVVAVHAPYALYQQLLDEASRTVVALRLDRLDPAMLDDIARELGAVGYEWYPDEARYLARPAGQRVAATFVTGGVIFGAYASCTGTEHVLQTKRARLFAELSVHESSGGLWGYQHETELFERLIADSGVHATDRTLPPSVVPMLLHTERPDSPVALLRAALEMRTDALGTAYREWQVVASTGDSAAAKDVDEMVGRKAKERDPLATSAGVATSIVVDSSNDDAAGAAVGTGGIRAWLVEGQRKRRHRKLMLRMNLAQPSYDDVTSQLKQLWYDS